MLHRILPLLSPGRCSPVLQVDIGYGLLNTLEVLVHRPGMWASLQQRQRVEAQFTPTELLLLRPVKLQPRLCWSLLSEPDQQSLAILHPQVLLNQQPGAGHIFVAEQYLQAEAGQGEGQPDRKSTRLNSSHANI